MALSIRRLSPAIGAEISGVDLSSTLSVDDQAAIYEAFLQHKVIFLRGQNLPPTSQLRFARLFGEPAGHPVNRTLAGPEALVQVVENDGTWERGHYYTDQWHSDVTFLPEPYKGAVLKAEILPQSGGDTLWCNLQTVYNLLPSRVQVLIEGLYAHHGWPLDAMVPAGDPAHIRGHVQPVVRVHPETGLKSLFVNEAFTRSIVGMGAQESRQILGLLFDAIKSPEAQVRFTWEEGSIAVWDNRCTAHYAVLDYAGRRVMHRVALAGAAPIAAAASH